MQNTKNQREANVGKQYRPKIKRKRAKKRLKRKKAVLKAKLSAK
jgi:hypothetical protein